MTDPANGDRDPGRLDAAPGLARIAAGAWLRTAAWTAGSTLRAGRRIGRAAITGESPLGLISAARDEVMEGAQRLLGVAELQQRLAAALAGDEQSNGNGSLRDRGAALLERSSELADDGDAHPAYARILGELSPDEARILRLLATGGPQPAVDVRTWRPLDVGSVAVAAGLSMIAQHAGCMHPDRVPSYLSNLYRLGLIWFSRETGHGPGRGVCGCRGAGSVIPRWRTASRASCGAALGAHADRLADSGLSGGSGGSGSAVMGGSLLRSRHGGEILREASPGHRAVFEPGRGRPTARTVERIGRAAPMGTPTTRADRRRRVTVAERGGEVVECSSSSRRPTISRRDVAVDPTPSGPRSLGRASWRTRRTRPRALGLAELRLYTNEHMVENIARQPRLGFRETERRAERGFARVFFEKKLA